MSDKRKQISTYAVKGLNFLDGSGDESGDMLPLDAIALPSSQPRKYFDEQAMEQLIGSVRERGVLQPVLVRPLPAGENGYELVAGERRFRAATAAGLDEIPVVIKTLDDEDAVEISILENLQREDLNPVEETEAILGLLSIRLGRSRADVISMLNQASHIGSSAADNVIRSTDWEDITAVFESIGRFTPESFRTNRLPLLSLPEDVLAQLRSGAIQYTKARAIAQVKGEKERAGLLKETVSEGLSLNSIKDRVKAIKQKKVPKRTKKVEAMLKLTSTVQSQLKKPNLTKDRDVLTQVESLLKEAQLLLKA